MYALQKEYNEKAHVMMVIEQHIDGAFVSTVNSECIAERVTERFCFSFSTRFAICHIWECNFSVIYTYECCIYCMCMYDNDIQVYTCQIDLQV